MHDAQRHLSGQLMLLGDDAGGVLLVLLLTPVLLSPRSCRVAKQKSGKFSVYSTNIVTFAFVVLTTPLARHWYW